MNVQITIRNRQFNVRTNDDGEQIRKMAKELDRRLFEQARRAQTFDEHSVTVITALNLMSELHLLRQQTAERLGGLERELESVMAMIESLLPKEDADSSD